MYTIFSYLYRKKIKEQKRIDLLSNLSQVLSVELDSNIKKEIVIKSMIHIIIRYDDRSKLNDIFTICKAVCKHIKFLYKKNCRISSYINYLYHNATTFWGVFKRIKGSHK